METELCENGDGDFARRACQLTAADYRYGDTDEEPDPGV